MADQDQGARAEVLERGNIYFFYRPAVGPSPPAAWWTRSGGQVEGGARLG